MKKIIMIMISGFMIFSCAGCSVTVTDTSDDELEEESEPEEVTEEEQVSDEVFENLKDTSKTIDVSELIGEYEMVVYTMSGYSYVKGTQDWIDWIGDTDADEDTILINIIDKKNMTFSNYGDVTKATYTMSGNVLSFEGEDSGEYTSDDLDGEEIYTVTEGVFVNGILVIDLNGSKIYFGKRGEQSDIEKAQKLEEKIESNSTVEIDADDDLSID